MVLFEHNNWSNARISRYRYGNEVESSFLLNRTAGCSSDCNPVRSVILGWPFWGQITADKIFETAFLDEVYQNSLWGADKEATDRQSAIRAEFKDVERFMNML